MGEVVAGEAVNLRGRSDGGRCLEVVWKQPEWGWKEKPRKGRSTGRQVMRKERVAWRRREAQTTAKVAGKREGERFQARGGGKGDWLCNMRQ